MPNTLSCPLCLESGLRATLVENRYAQCPRCALRFLAPEFRLHGNDEKERYLLHTDDPHDQGYQKYLKPLYDAICERIPVSSHGLDYGCGRAPVLGNMLEEKGYSISGYDPFFAPSLKVLDVAYDFIITTEVVEHFFHPQEEFQRLRKLIKSGGTLGIVTRLYDGVNFSEWFYRRDPTHVSLYSRQTFSWIADSLGWSEVLFIDNKTIILK